MTPKMIEEKARELFSVAIKRYPKKHQDWDLVRADLQENWCVIAQHVLIGEIRAYLEGLKFCKKHTKCHELVIDEKLKELDDILAVLKVGKDVK